MQGFLLVDKPRGLSSFAVIARLRRVTGERRIGHAGTLDPFASGLLIVAIGRTYTRQLSRFQVMIKGYRVGMRCGIATDTGDSYGQIVNIASLPVAVPSGFSAFVGSYNQVPPAYSAVHIQGKRAYQWARQGQPQPLPARPVTIYHIQLGSVHANYDYPLIRFDVSCSTGTYIRQLVMDIGKQEGVPAYTQDLRRTGIGDYRVDEALHVDAFTKEAIEKQVFV